MKQTVIFILAILMLFLAACGPSVTRTEPVAVPPTAAAPTQAPPTATSPAPTATTAAVETPITEPGAAGALVARDIRLDPALASDADSRMLNGYLYEGLLGPGTDGQFAPALAIAWTVSEDQLDYIFELRPQVTFADGTALNADAVLANFNRWFDPENPLHGSNAIYTAWQEQFLGFKGEVDANGQPVSPFDGIEKVNDLTVLIHLNRPDPDFLARLAQPAFALVSPAALQATGEQFGLAAGSVSGTGPYMIGEWSEAGLVLVPNPNYWGEPVADELAFGWK